jgi:hypothetical protein
MHCTALVKWPGQIERGAARQHVPPPLQISLLLAEAVQHGLRTIAFCKTRKLSEMVARYTHDTLRLTAPALADRVAVYRGGYTPAERRGLEAALHGGRLLGVAATNALELGIDVGALDATLHLVSAPQGFYLGEGGGAVHGACNQLVAHARRLPRRSSLHPSPGLPRLCVIAVAAGRARGAP